MHFFPRTECKGLCLGCRWSVVPDPCCAQVEVAAGWVMLGGDTRWLMIFAWLRFRGMGPTTSPPCLLSFITMTRMQWRGGKARRDGAADLRRHSQVADDVICQGWPEKGLGLGAWGRKDCVLGCLQGLSEGVVQEHRGSCLGWAVRCTEYTMDPATSVLSVQWQEQN